MRDSRKRSANGGLHKNKTRKRKSTSKGAILLPLKVDFLHCFETRLFCSSPLFYSSSSAFAWGAALSGRMGMILFLTIKPSYLSLNCTRP